jgi:rhamnogalacturonyl hydrolase YesR
MARQLGDDRARRVTEGVAQMILHRTARNYLGLVAHDDHADFAIPDTCFFATEALMDAYALEPETGQAFLDEAVVQLRGYLDTFLVPESGLARTILRGGRLGNTYWTRASGWLIWAVTGVLRHLPRSDASRPGFLDDLSRLASGMAKVQDAEGGFHVLLDEPKTPLETTGTAMYAAGLHESMRRGWLPEEFRGSVERAWQFVNQNLTDDGRIRNAYTGWALPAEDREIEHLMDAHEMGWIPGFILRTAEELTTPWA